jgi:hypothetical protein
MLIEVSEPTKLDFVDVIFKSGEGRNKELKVGPSHHSRLTHSSS